MNNKKLWVVVLSVIIILTGMIVGVNFFNKMLGNNQEHPNTSTKKDQCTVTFYSNEGTVLKVDFVEKGLSANPPEQPQLLYGAMFKSWDADLSSIKENIDVHPICEIVKGKPNVFMIEGAYGMSGGTVVVPVRLCGEVCVSAFDLTISYDDNVLELVSVVEDGAVLYNKEVPGTIQLNYVSTENTIADVDICYLEFSVKSQSGQTPIQLEVHNIYACENPIESNNDDLYVPEYSNVNANVFVLSKEE